MSAITLRYIYESTLELLKLKNAEIVGKGEDSLEELKVFFIAEFPKRFDKIDKLLNVDLLRAQEHINSAMINLEHNQLAAALPHFHLAEQDATSASVVSTDFEGKLLATQIRILCTFHIQGYFTRVSFDGDRFSTMLQIVLDNLVYSSEVQTALKNASQSGSIFTRLFNSGKVAKNKQIVTSVEELSAQLTKFTGHQYEIKQRGVKPSSPSAKGTHIRQASGTGVLSIRHVDIPEYMQKSDYFRNLSPDNSSEEIFIPAECYKYRDTASNLADFTQLLRVMKFWKLDEIPLGVMQYCVENDFAGWAPTAADILGRSEQLNTLVTVFRDGREGILERAAPFKRLELSSFLTSYTSSPNDIRSTDSVPQLNRLPVFLRSQKARGSTTSMSTVSTRDMSSASTASVASSNADLRKRMESIRDQAKDVNEGDTEFTSTPRCCPIGVDVTYVAAGKGHLDCLKYAMACGIAAHPDACTAAAAGGHLACLAYLRECYDAPWDMYTTAAAAREGQVTTLRYAIDRNCPYVDNGELLKLAAEASSGSLPCLQYLIDEQGMYMAEDGSLFAAAFQRLDLECLQYLKTFDCPIVGFEFEALQPYTITDWPVSDLDEKFRNCIVYAVECGWEVSKRLVDYVHANETLYPLCTLLLIVEEWLLP